ncbi:hypothetical protein JYT44_00140 [Caldithrix abyssi]|nr:hypothetical protein [Caldithrix abyssi]
MNNKTQNANGRNKNGEAGIKDFSITVIPINSTNNTKWMKPRAIGVPNRVTIV